MQQQAVHGFVYCYNSLYKLLFYWGGVTFQLQRDGGPKSTPLRIAYVMAIRCCFICGYLFGVYIKRSDARMAQAMFSHLSPVVKIILCWECLSCTLTYIHFCITQDTQRSRHMKLLVDMQRLDTEISTQFSHVRWRYERSRNKYFYGTVGVTVCYFTLSLALMFDTTRCSCGFVSTILIAITYSLITSSLGVMGFTHIALMDYIRIRFRLIVKLLAQSYKQADDGLKYESVEELQRRIDTLFDYSKRCTQLLLDMNTVCGSVAATGLFYDFTHMTGFVYVLCQKFLSSEPFDIQYAFITLHLAVHMYKVIMTSIYGYLLQREKRNCMHLLSDYASHFGNRATIRHLVEHYQHWRIHNNHAATVGSSLPCNISMIYVIFNGLANYVIVLVQLLFQLQLKDKQGIHLPKDVELISPIAQLSHQNKIV